MLLLFTASSNFTDLLVLEFLTLIKCWPIVWSVPTFVFLAKSHPVSAGAAAGPVGQEGGEAGGQLQARAGAGEGAGAAAGAAAGAGAGAAAGAAAGAYGQCA